MKRSSQRLFPSTKQLVFLVGSALGLTLASCHRTSQSHAFTGIAGDRIGDDYVYYPTYEVYYSPASREYVYYNGSTWVREATPRQPWAADVRSSPSVPMVFHDAPERHHGEIVRQYPRSWKPGDAVPAERARTTNDDLREGKSTR